MKKFSIILNVIFVILILTYTAYRSNIFSPEKPWVVFTSTSPDGKWRCIVTDINPGKHQ